MRGGGGGRSGLSDRPEIGYRRKVSNGLDVDQPRGVAAVEPPLGDVVVMVEPPL